MILSLSARRAWIEMGQSETGDPEQYVALRKESVDRNTDRLDGAELWFIVALRKESVDRN